MPGPATLDHGESRGFRVACALLHPARLASHFSSRPRKETESNKGYANGTERVQAHARWKVGCAILPSPSVLIEDEDTG